MLYRLSFLMFSLILIAVRNACAVLLKVPKSNLDLRMSEDNEDGKCRQLVLIYTNYKYLNLWINNYCKKIMFMLIFFIKYYILIIYIYFTFRSINLLMFYLFFCWVQ